MEGMFDSLIRVFCDLSPLYVSLMTFFVVYLAIRMIAKSYDSNIFNVFISLIITISLYFSTIFFFKLSRFDYFFDGLAIIFNWIIYNAGMWVFNLILVRFDYMIYGILFLIPRLLIELNVLFSIDLLIVIKIYLKQARLVFNKEYDLVFNLVKKIKINLVNKINLIKNIYNNNLKLALSTLNC